MAGKYADILKQTPNGAAEPVEEIVAEFVQFRDSLEELDFVSAEIEATGSIGPSFSLVTSPAHRRDEKTHMLTYIIHPDRVEVVGPAPEILRTREEAERFIKSFASNPVFQNSLAIYRQREAEPFHGTLRQGEWNELTSRDVVVLLTADQQDEIANKAPDEPIDLSVKQQDPPQLGRFVDGTSYEYLESSGFIIKVKSAKLEEGLIRIVGTIYEPPESPFLA